MTRPADVPEWAWEKALLVYAGGEEYVEFLRQQIVQAPIGSATTTVERIARALMKAGPGWQPIETAPKNGAEILGCSAGNYDCEVVWFGACDTLGLSDAEGEAIDEETYWFESWWASSIDGATRLEGDVAPTHWRPKPLPPSEFIKAERTIDGAQVGVVFPKPKETGNGQH